MNWQQLLNSGRRKASTRQSGEFRKEFARDYDRAVFSTPVRRLQDKAQVFPLEPHDSVRTRLTHSLEVSTVARDLAGEAAQNLLAAGNLESLDQVNAIQNIAATCGLIHDIGNPPFGHAGEQAINSWFCKKFGDIKDLKTKIGVISSSHNIDQLANDFWNFEGNAQTLRLIAKLQVLSDLNGLNFTYGTLSAACKYIAPSHLTMKSDHRKNKPGYFASENELIQEIRMQTGTGDSRNPITFLVEASDDIVYSVVDIEDGVKKGVVDWALARTILLATDCAMMKSCFDRVDNYFKTSLPVGLDDKRNFDEAQVQMFRVMAISLMVPAVLKTFSTRYESIMQGTYHKELIDDTECEAACFVRNCKDFSRKYVYTSKETLRLELMGRQVIHDLMDIFWEGISNFDESEAVGKFPNKIYNLLSRNYRVVYDEARKSDLPLPYCQMQLMTDYICGMTDTFACTLHKQLKNG